MRSETQTTSKLVLCLDFLEDEPEIRPRVWELVAYALFSSHARTSSSVTSVDLNDCWMRETDAEAVVRVVASRDPTTSVLVRPSVRDERADVGNCWRGGGDRPLATGMLTQGTVLTLLPMDVSESFVDEAARWSLATDVCGIQLLLDAGDQDFASMVVPGYGVCEVRRDHVIPIDDTCQTHEVTSLSINFAEYSSECSGLGRFLELVGLPLTSLSVAFPTLIEPWLPIILELCPNLKTPHCLMQWLCQDGAVPPSM